MNDTVHLVDWVVVVGHLGRFTASALVNGNVHNDRTRAHLAQVGTADNLRRLFARNQHSTHHQVRCLQSIFYVDIVGVEGLHSCAKDVVQIFQPMDVDVHDGDVGSHADCDFAGVGTDTAAA